MSELEVDGVWLKEASLAALVLFIVTLGQPIPLARLTHRLPLAE